MQSLSFCIGLHRSVRKSLCSFCRVSRSVRLRFRSQSLPVIEDEFSCFVYRLAIGNQHLLVVQAVVSILTAVLVCRHILNVIELRRDLHAVLRAPRSGYIADAVFDGGGCYVDQHHALGIVGLHIVLQSLRPPQIVVSVAAGTPVFIRNDLEIGVCQNITDIFVAAVFPCRVDWIFYGFIRSDQVLNKRLIASSDGIVFLQHRTVFFRIGYMRHLIADRFLKADRVGVMPAHFADQRALL